MPEGLSAILFSGLLFGGLADFKWLESPLQGCAARDQTSIQWRSEGRQVFDHQVADWCVVASIHKGAWEAEQWSRSSGPSGHGWHVRLPLKAVKPSLARGGQQEQVFHVGDQKSLRIRPAHGSSLHEAHRRERARLSGEEPTGANQDSPQASDQRFWISHFQGKQGARGLITLRVDGEGWFHVSLHQSDSEALQ